MSTVASVMVREAVHEMVETVVVFHVVETDEIIEAVQAEVTHTLVPKVESEIIVDMMGNDVKAVSTVVEDVEISFNFLP